MIIQEDKFYNNGQMFKQLNAVNTIAAIPHTKTLENIKINIKRNYLRLHNLKEFKIIKKGPIALIGGGPSITKELSNISKFKTKIACGSVHDYLVENNIFCEYATICDPDPVSANYFRNPVKYTKYLVSTGCDEAVYESLKSYNIWMWHCHSEELLKIEVEKDFHAVGGGCTVGLRSLSIALMLGYSDIHFFGFDSCLGINNSHHAYDFTDKSEELGVLYKIHVGTEQQMFKNKEFICAGYHIAQAQHFKDFYKNYNKYFNFTFHGEGLISELMKIEKKDYVLKDRALESLISQPEGTMI